jgi:hypothetical protein
MTDISERLEQLAENWPFYPDTAVDRHGHHWPVDRCAECLGACVRGTEGRLGHLTLEHGWRLNGRRYDNQNNLLETL